MKSVKLSVIVPVHNGAGYLLRNLPALKREIAEGEEIIVVDDASGDESFLTAQREGVAVIRMNSQSGPALARNTGAKAARGNVFLFVDSDVVIAEGSLSRVRRFFQENPETVALIGSYDKLPFARGVVTQYRNLLHHFVHQHSEGTPSHFWTGLGAVRREQFFEVGGFNPEVKGIEDVEFGYRLRKKGLLIGIDKDLQGKHLKRWSFFGMVFTDVFMRAVPWTRLMLRCLKGLPSDFSLSKKARMSVVSAGIFFLSLIFSFLNPLSLLILLLSGGCFVGINRELLRFFLRERGFVFSLAACFLHLLYSFYSGTAFICSYFCFITINRRSIQGV
jgi:glycosyltransferase involved in cell wall biosynthesis